MLTSTTDGNLVNTYRVQNYVNPVDCSGEVTAIEYCYQYRTLRQEEPVFNWTVVILEETQVFTITKIIAIESHPHSLQEEDCEPVNGLLGVIKCCDRDNIINLNLQTNNNFVFGVTESAQGNTHGATLLGYHEANYGIQADTLLLTKAGLTVSVGSTLNKIPGVPRGLRMLWLVIGKYASLITIITNRLLDITTYRKY